MPIAYSPMRAALSLFANMADDSPQAQRYNRISRQLGILDALLGLAMLVVLLATGWTKKLAHLSLVVVANDQYELGLFLARFVSLPVADEQEAEP